MKNVDCEWLINESHNCSHKNRRTIFGSAWSPTCIEYKIKDVSCNYRESIWDMIKKQHNNHQNPTRPPAPPAPPPKRVYKNDKRVYNTDDDILL